MHLAGFHPVVREWFAEAFPAGPTLTQQQGWPVIASGQSTLILAPTGSGKTLAAFLSALDRLAFEPRPPRNERCRVLYISPMKALAVDIERNLRGPIAGIAKVAERRGEAVELPVVTVRSGDTPAETRVRMLRHPPDILVTTPESLFLMLTSRARATLESVRLVIVDEIHVLASTKRGAHLTLSLERLEALTGRTLQRVGLSATQRPLAEVARFLGGGTPTPRWTQRPVAIVDAGSRRAFDVSVRLPAEDMGALGTFVEVGPQEGTTVTPVRQTLWASLHPRLLELVRTHKTTLVFVNSRRLAERTAAALNDLSGETLARAHHGSIAREERLEMEEALKAGDLRVLVATSTLELGIDMGAIDLVVQIETPPSVASGMQRIGRAGHQVGAVSRGILFPKHRGDLVAAAALAHAMREGEVETTKIPSNPLDVLAQQIVAMAATATWKVDDLHSLVRRAAPYAKLSRRQLEGVLDMLSGRYVSDEFAELRPRLVWDRTRDTIRAREGAHRIVVANAGTIPDRGLYGVFLVDNASPGGDGRPRRGRRVGELDEEMVFETREGEVFVLGASSWRIAEIDRDRVLVVPAPGQPGKMPFWKADRAQRPVEQGARIGRLTRELLAGSREASTRRLQAHHGLDAAAASNLLQYLEDQRDATGVVPDDQTLVVERLQDEMGDWRLCLLSPFGGRVHTPWSLAVSAALAAKGGPKAEPVSGDDGIVWRFPETDRPPDTALLLPDPDEVRELVLQGLGSSALFAAYFREAAARALLLPRRRPGQRSPLWMQRKRAADLLAVASRYGSFPILLETFRECLEDVFDLPALEELLRRIRRREVRVVTVDRTKASPFAASLLFGYVGNFLYDADAPPAERRAQALSIDLAQLRELLGEADLRELLDPLVLRELEDELQGTDGRHGARSADGLHDLLLRVGDLTTAELEARIAPSGEAEAERTALLTWILVLAGEGRVVEVMLGGETRWIAAEDAGRYRDAFGVRLPPGIHPSYLAPVAAPLADLTARYARSRGPFAASDLSRRFGLGEADAARVLAELEVQGRLVEGSFRARGSGCEWCAAPVLQTLRRRSLAHLRKEVEPTGPEALSRLLLDWQGLDTPVAASPDALLDIVEQLQGAIIPASTLETDVLPARLTGYRKSDLDALCSAGEILLVGCGRLGEHDGRLALYLAEEAPLLHPTSRSKQDELATWSPLHRRLLAHLESQGASFFKDLFDASGERLHASVLDALWDLLWGGEVSNDSPAAFRAYLSGRASRLPSRVAKLSGFRSRRDTPQSGIGRWSRLVMGAPPDSPDLTRLLTARAKQLLLRHGVLTREALTGEENPGGIGALYGVLRAMEEAGRIRRGYFVSGHGGLQFADAGALERLRRLREPSGAKARVLVLAATDPAQAFGASLPWPQVTDGPRPMRTAGAHVVLVDGGLSAFIGRDEGEARSFLPATEPDRSCVARALAEGLALWLPSRGKTLLGWAPGVHGLADDPLAPFLLEAGFTPSGRGFRLADVKHE